MTTVHSPLLNIAAKNIAQKNIQSQAMTASIRKRLINRLALTVHNKRIKPMPCAVKQETPAPCAQLNAGLTKFALAKETHYLPQHTTQSFYKFSSSHATTT